jgi:hypothetical protein
LEIRKFDLDYIDPDPTIGDWGWAQRPFIAEIERQYNQDLPVRIICLKARQLGISTATEAVVFLWSFLHPGSNGLVVSHVDGQTQELFQMTKLYWETWPHKSLFSLRYGTRRQMMWEDTRSQIRVATAGKPESLRGSTIHALHGSEVAFWPDPGTLWTGLSSTLHDRHHTIAVLESTANGVGNWFHERWLEAEAGDSDYTPMFFPWYRHSAYRAHHSLIPADLTADERNLVRKMTGEGFTDDTAMAAMYWRRLEIRKKGGEDSFMQEYPATAEEAFIVSGRPIFPAKDVQDAFEEVPSITGMFYRDGRGEVSFKSGPGDWTLFKTPSPDIRPDLYMIGGDPSRTVYGDPGSIQVINRVTFEQVAVWNGHKLPHEFAEEMMLVGSYFHHGMLCPEVEGGGQGCISVLLSSGYPNIWYQHWADRAKTSTSMMGWSTNYQRKRWAISRVQQLLRDGSLRLHDRRTIHELLYFTENEEGILGNSGQAKHDDTVMALAIAITASISEGPVIPTSAQQRFTPDIYTSELEDNIISLSSRMRN